VETSVQQVTRWRFIVHDYHRMGEAGIWEVWIVNLPARTIEQHTDPSNEGYRRVDHKRGGPNLQPAALPGLTPTVDEVFS